MIAEAERKGTPRQLFWPWFGANVSVFGLAYGSFLLGFGISFWQAVVAGVVGIVVSFLLCGLIAIAGKRGSAPTLVLSRAAFGVNGNRVPVGAVLGADRRLGDGAGLAGHAGDRAGLRPARLGRRHARPRSSPCWWSPRSSSRGGVLGFDVIMRMQTVITWVTGILTVVYIVLVADHIDWSAVSALPQRLDAGVHRRARARHDRLRLRLGQRRRRLLPLPARARPPPAASSAGRRSAARWRPVVLLVAGLLLAGSDSELSAAIGARPDRRPRHAPAHLVPRAVHPRRGARPDRRRAARHLLVGPVAARGRAAGAPPGRGHHRRHAHGHRHDRRRLLRRQTSSARSRAS